MSDPISSSPLGNDPIDSNEPNFVAQLGRISGKLLSENLLRDGVPLSFRINNDLENVFPILHINTENRQVGVNTDIISTDLRIAPNTISGSTGTTKTINIEILNNANISNLAINQNGNISSTQGPIIISPNQQLNPFLRFQRLLTDDLEINDNFIKNINENGDIVLEASGTGNVIFDGNIRVSEDLSVLGNINIDGNLSKQGNIIIGDNIFEDFVVIQTDFTQDILPGITDTYDIGSFTKKWRNAYINEPYNDFVAVSNFINVNGKLAIDGNNRRFFTQQLNDNISIEADSNIVQIETIEISGDEIRNLVNTPLIFTATGIGYYRFAGTNGFVVPVGTIAERIGNEIGETRWNSELGYLECFDGSVWIISTGPGATISQEDMEDLGRIYTLILG
jgi:hypothetical protein